MNSRIGRIVQTGFSIYIDIVAHTVYAMILLKSVYLIIRLELYALMINYS